MLRIILVLFFLFLPLQGCYSQEQKEPAGEMVMNDPYTWDFGQVNEGDVLKHAFILKNESERTLTINEINTSCGCTASKTEKKVLAPGEDTSIEVQFKSKGYSGMTQQFVYVHTDSLDNPIIRFTVKADVIKSVSNSSGRE